MGDGSLRGCPGFLVPMASRSLLSDCSQPHAVLLLDGPFWSQGACVWPLVAAACARARLDQPWCGTCSWILPWAAWLELDVCYNMSSTRFRLYEVRYCIEK